MMSLEGLVMTTEHPRTVLVVNGMQDMVELFRVYLVQDGWVVVTAAVDSAKRGRLDLQRLVESGIATKLSTPRGRRARSFPSCPACPRRGR